MEDIDLGSMDFWAQPAEVPERSFAVLRREAPVSHHPPPEDILQIERDERGYWAIVRYEDVRAISRAPATFCSGQGCSSSTRPPRR